MPTNPDKSTARGAQAKGRRGKAEPSNNEEVTAADIEVGDMVFFPSSRHAQPVGSTVQETGSDEEEIRRISNEDRTTEWVLKASAPVKREIRS